MKNVFKGKFVEVADDDGIERVYLRGSVHTFLITEDKQIRLTIERKLGIEDLREKLQSGILEVGEVPLDAAKRELVEELGIEAKEWQEFLVQKFSGVVNDMRYYYLAKDLMQVSESTDREIIGTNDYDLHDLYEKAMSGYFSPMTQAAIAKLHYEVARGAITL